MKDRRTYTGSTPDLDARINEHIKGKCLSTKNRRPLKLILKVEYSTLEEARKRERFLKTRTGRRELKKILQHKIPNIPGV